MDLNMVKYLAELSKLEYSDYLNDLRKDEVIESMPTSKVLSNAVNTNNCFVVPKVVE